MSKAPIRNSANTVPAAARTAMDSKSTVKLGYRDYACFPDDGRRHEIIAGEHFVNPAPATYHQTLSRRLQTRVLPDVSVDLSRVW
jgi:hypothetical protein